MRRLRPFPLYWSAILAVVLGAVAVPATALADGEDVVLTDGTVPAGGPGDCGTDATSAKRTGAR